VLLLVLWCSRVLVSSVCTVSLAARGAQRVSLIVYVPYDGSSALSLPALSHPPAMRALPRLPLRSHPASPPLCRAAGVPPASLHITAGAGELAPLARKNAAPNERAAAMLPQRRGRCGKSFSMLRACRAPFPRPIFLKFPAAKCASSVRRLRKARR